MPLPTNYANNDPGHTAAHNATNTQVNTNTTDIALRLQGGQAVTQVVGGDGGVAYESAGTVPALCFRVTDDDFDRMQIWATGRIVVGDGTIAPANQIAGDSGSFQLSSGTDLSLATDDAEFQMTAAGAISMSGSDGVTIEADGSILTLQGGNSLMAITVDNDTITLTNGTDTLTLDDNGLVKFNTQIVTSHLPARTVTGNDAAVYGDVIKADATGGALTITLPVADATSRQVIVKKVDASVNAVTVAPVSGTIDGAADVDITIENASLTLLPDGTDWILI